MVRDFVKATNDRDADAFCEDIVTQKFIEKATGAKEGEHRKCKRQLDAVTAALQARAIGKAEMNGDKATVPAVLEVQGQPQTRVFRLEKEDGDWKLAGGTA